MSSGGTQEEKGCNDDDDEASVRSWWNMIHWIAGSISSVSVECKPTTILSNSWSWSWSWSYLYRSLTLPFSSSSTVTGTILCKTNNNTTSTSCKKKNIKGSGSGTLKLCIQDGGPAGPPILVIDLPIASHELQGECSRIVLECEHARSGGGPLMATSMWVVYFNGKKVGFGWRREAEDDHVGTALYSIRNVSAGMGLLPPIPMTSTLESSDDIIDNPERGGGGGYEYLRGRFERVVGSADSESYHLLDPARGCLDGHDLSFFFVRL